MDEELGPGLKAALEEYLSECQICSEAHSQLREQKARIRLVAPYYTAPSQLKRSVSEHLGQYWAVSDITIAELDQFKDLNEKIHRGQTDQAPRPYVLSDARVI